MADFLDLLLVWGPCPAASPPAARGPIRPIGHERSSFRSADLDGDGVVGRGDARIMRSSWGPCGADCAADLDADGRVDVRDLLALLANWG
jgi:hypothetical protein